MSTETILRAWKWGRLASLSEKCALGEKTAGVKWHKRVLISLTGSHKLNVHISVRCQSDSDGHTSHVSINFTSLNGVYLLYIFTDKEQEYEKVK